MIVPFDEGDVFWNFIFEEVAIWDIEGCEIDIWKMFSKVSSITKLAGANFKNFVATFDKLCDIFSLSYEIGSIESFPVTGDSHVDIASTAGMDVIIEKIGFSVVFCDILFFGAMCEEGVEIVIFFDKREALVDFVLLLEFWFIHMIIVIDKRENL